MSDLCLRPGFAQGYNTTFYAKDMTVELAVRGSRSRVANGESFAPVPV